MAVCTLVTVRTEQFGRSKGVASYNKANTTIGTEVQSGQMAALLAHWIRCVSRSILPGIPLSGNPATASLSASILPAHLSGLQRDTRTTPQHSMRISVCSRPSSGGQPRTSEPTRNTVRCHKAIASKYHYGPPVSRALSFRHISLPFVHHGRSRRANHSILITISGPPKHKPLEWPPTSCRA